ncbi:MAG: tetraacyldisaccharide 4'-kinase [Alphaproteobacteria bacterium]|nr:tetraacyldisaccharide 4'-kinase [Alphaproteobacteria bacterium]
MREPAFWSRPPGLASALLSPFAAIYGAIAARRMDRPGRDAGIPVVCIGNLTAGGAGKTPAAIAVARILRASGLRPFLLSRGYGGRLPGPVQVDPARHTAADVGDEPLLLARAAPTVVAHDRPAGAELAKAQGATVIAMDDGFQNPSLAKTLSIVVVDAQRGVGNGCVIPAGPLRAPLDAQMAHAHAVLAVGAGQGAASVEAAARLRGLRVFHGRLVPDMAAIADLLGTRALAFAGIGDPEKFFATAVDAGIDVRVRAPFPDHHRFRRAEAEALIAQAEREGLMLLTTEKDLARMAGDNDLVALARAARALPVTLVVEEAAAFRDLVLSRAA